MLSYTQTKTTKTITTQSKVSVETSIDKYQTRIITKTIKAEANTVEDKKEKYKNINQNIFRKIIAQKLNEIKEEILKQRQRKTEIF